MKLIPIICRFCTCKFTYSLKLTHNLQVSTHGAFAEIQSSEKLSYDPHLTDELQQVLRLSSFHTEVIRERKQ